MKLPLTYDNYIFDLYGTLVDIHTDEEMREMEREYMRRTTRQTA